MDSTISAVQLLTLENAQDQFLYDHDYGAVELEEVMFEVFGTDRSTQDAQKWQQHWTALEVYEEETRSNPGSKDPPQVYVYSDIELEH